MTEVAFILAAGLGTRLRPLTDELPKPLVPIFNKPLITFALDHLIAAGVQRFVINTHRLPHLFAQMFASGSYRGHAVQLIHEPDLLETGGGIKNAEPFLAEETFITYSGDILTDLDLQPLIAEHFRAGNDVTLALRETGLGAEIAFQDGRVTAIAKAPGNFDFANIAVWNRGIFSRLLPGKKTSFIPVLAEWIREGGKIGGVVVNDGKWFNIGSAAEYLNVHRTIFSQNWKPPYVRDADWPRAVTSSAVVAAKAELRGCSAIGDDCRVADDARLTDTILWPSSQVAPRSELRSCIVRAGRSAEGIIEDTVI